MGRRWGRFCRAAALSVATAWGASVLPAAAQVTDGEALVNRDVEVRVAPSPDAAVVRSLSKGQTVSVYGTPRRTAFAWIGRGGQILGYIPIDSIDPVWSAREVVESVALVDRRFVDAGGQLMGTHVVAAAVGSGRQGFPRGSIVKVEAIDGGMAQVSADGRRGSKVPVEALRPIIGVRQNYPSIAGDAPNFYLSKLGDYVSPTEANAAWTTELSFVAERQSQATPFIYPTVRKGTLSYSVATGPLARADAEALCIYASRRGRDCYLVEVGLY